jgi:hypothetical protein
MWEVLVAIQRNMPNSFTMITCSTAIPPISLTDRYRRNNSQGQSSSSYGPEGEGCCLPYGGDTLFCFHQTVLFDLAFVSELYASGRMPLDLTCNLQEIWNEQASLTMPAARGRPSVQVALEIHSLERFKRPSLKVHCI